jgi:siroheme synthase-like protein
VSAELLFPVFLKLGGRKVLLVGAGPVATSKLAGLEAVGADITVVAPEMTETIQQSGARLVRRTFEESDLDDAWYVVAAATPDVNAAVARAAQARHLFVNAVDDPPNATAYLGGVVRRSGAVIAISTSGRAPSLAGLLREAIDRLLPSDRDLDAWFHEGDALKAVWRSTGVPMDERRAQMAGVVAREYCGRMPSCAHGRGAWAGGWWRSFKAVLGRR